MKQQLKRKKFYSRQKWRSRRWFNVMHRAPPEANYTVSQLKTDRNTKRYDRDRRKLNRLYQWGQNLRWAEFLNS